jgi:predicted dehydrogenase
MADIRIGVIINGASGRIGTTQHIASLRAIAADGGLKLGNGDRLMPDLMLVGRDATRMAAHAAAHGNQRWTTSLEEALAGPDKIFMDCSATGGRPERVRQAIAAGKHIFIEKPTASSVEEAMALAKRAHQAGVKHGVIQDKLFLPGFAKLMFVRNAGFFGRILSVRVDAGSWIFDGTAQECQRPSWNYRKSDGGGLALDMMAHWRYMIDRLVAPIVGVSAVMSTAIPERVDEHGVSYKVDAEDTVYALLKMKDGSIGQITNSWATRPRRADTMMVHIDGTNGSASAGDSSASPRRRSIRRRRSSGRRGRAAWIWRRTGKRCLTRATGCRPSASAGRTSCGHVGEDGPYLPTLVEGAKAVQLADLAYRSVAEQRWIDVPELRL